VHTEADRSWLSIKGILLSDSDLSVEQQIDIIPLFPFLNNIGVFGDHDFISDRQNDLYLTVIQFLKEIIFFNNILPVYLSTHYHPQE
jgi:hypothetical protein